MGKTKRFSGASVDIKELLADAPKVRTNAWKQGPGAAALVPKSKSACEHLSIEVPQASSRQSVQTEFSQLPMQLPTNALPMITQSLLKEAAAQKIEMESTTGSEPSGLLPEAVFNEEGSLGSIDVGSMLSGGAAELIGGRHRRRRPRPKRQLAEAVIVHTEPRQFEVPPVWSSKAMSGEANPMDDQVPTACGGGQPKVVTELWQAVKNGDAEAVSLLIDTGACLNTKAKDGDTPLIKAAGYGHVGVVRALLHAGAGINKRGRALRSQTALMRAVVSGHDDVVKLLLEARADANIPDSDNKRPIDRAAEQGNTSLVEILFAHSDEDLGILPRAVQAVLDAGHDSEVPAFLLRKGCSVEGLSWPEVWGSDQTAFMRAVRMDRQDLVRCLSKAAVPVSTQNSSGETPLVLAVKRGSPDMVRTLLECSCAADGAWLRTTPLVHAVRADRSEIVEILLDAGSSIGDAAQAAAVSGQSCSRLLQAAAERRSLILTLHVEPAASESMLDVICTDMGGSELASVCAVSSAPLKELRLAIEADLGDCEFPPQLLLPDGRLLATEDDERLLWEVLGSAAEPLARMDPTYV